MTPADRRPLHAGGPAVSPLCLGTMMFADQTGPAEAAKILHLYMNAGGNFIDTADTYSGGRCEEMLASLLAPVRERLVIATKLGNPVAGIEGSGGLSAAWVKTAVEGSLSRLGIDRIDLLYLHLEDEETPLEETIAALADQIAEGRIAAWGFSNFRGWKIAEMVRLADAMGAPRPVACQPYYHMLYRQAEVDILPACAHFGIGIVPYSVLARGVLTGKYRGDTVPEGSRAGRGDTRLLQTEFRPETLAAAGRAADHAEGRGMTPMGFALNWVLANRIVTSALVGPKRAEQMAAYVNALAEPFGVEDEAFAEALNPAGCAPSPAYADPKYPYRGRRTGEAAP